MVDVAELWQQILTEVNEKKNREPELAEFFDNHILCHTTLHSALVANVAPKLATTFVTEDVLKTIFSQALTEDEQILLAASEDLVAYHDRDPACDEYSLPLLFYKGFQALQAYRVAHFLWRNNRKDLALHFQHTISTVFHVDVHPAASIGRGIMIDHATGVVIGETAQVGNNVSLLHSVTLGGSGCTEGERHPKVGDGVLISTGAKLLGNIEIGTGAKIAAGSLVLEDVAAHATVAGVPARVVGKSKTDQPALEMNQQIDD